MFEGERDGNARANMISTPCIVGCLCIHVQDVSQSCEEVADLADLSLYLLFTSRHARETPPAHAPEISGLQRRMVL